jgi:hypothetical protein
MADSSEHRNEIQGSKKGSKFFDQRAITCEEKPWSIEFV